MDGTWWLLPVLIVVAVGVTAGYFFGRKTNATLMKAYANALENSLKPIDQDYTWLGGYVGYRATYKVKNNIVKQVKATLHLRPRMSMLYLPVARFTMPNDKLFMVFECKQSLPGEAHLIRKGMYRVLPAGIEDEDRFRRRDVTVGGEDFRLLSLDSRGEKEIMRWAEDLRADDYSMVKHLSYTSSTNVVYAYIEPDEALISAIVSTAPRFAARIAH